MSSVFFFLLSVLLVSISDSWGACTSGTFTYTQGLTLPDCYGGRNCNTPGFPQGVTMCYNVLQDCGHGCPLVVDNSRYIGGVLSPSFLTGNFAIGSSVCLNANTGCTKVSGTPHCYYRNKCDSQAEADSVNCANDPTGPACKPTYHCQNSGGAEPGGVGGSPSRALIFRCVGGVCTQTATLNGSCQDWGYCGEGESDCNVPDTSGHPPCRRSGAEYISGRSCYYQCADGSSMRCNPVSTDYIAGSQWAGRCPDSPPSSCYRSSSSAAPGSSDSGGSSPAPGSSDSGGSSGSGGSGDDSGEYMQVLEAIKDTLHRANMQRDAVNGLLGDIADNSFNNWRINYVTSQGVDQLNNRLSTLQERILPIAEASRASADSSTSLLTAINDYLRDDSLWQHPDTSYNPLLRDIKDALGSGGSVRDSAFARWWSDYNQDTAAQKGVLGKIYDNIKDSRDSVLSRNCTGFNECIAVYKDIGYCKNAWGVSTVDCVDGGSPLDNVLNVEASILSTLWDAIWGEDSTAVDTVSRLDTSVTFSPEKDTAQGWLSRAFSALFSPESTQSILQKVERMKDSVEQAKNDSVKVQPDSLWLDSSQAAAYIQNMLLPPGTVNECWVCHADLGTFGGLAPDGLSIDVDFGNFAGFDFCAIIRAVVKISAFVVCMSLTLGSWMAAFGYNPKNDA